MLYFLICIILPNLTRFRKLFTAVATVGVGVQAMFFSDYDIDGFEGQDHIFTGLQKDTRNWIDQNIYGIDTSSVAKSGNSNSKQSIPTAPIPSSQSDKT